MPKHQINPNFRYLVKSYTQQKYDGDELVGGKRGVILEGSSRSGKTYSSVDFIIWLCTTQETNCKINIYREFFADFKDTLYDDFKRRLDDFGLKNPFHNAQIVRSFKIFNNTISFKGCDKLGSKHGAGADYVFYNEMIHVPQGVFDQSEMRCRKFWWGDYNPSVTEHWIFNRVIPRHEIGYLHTTFIQNPFISVQEKRKILSYEPWMPNTYTVEENIIIYNGSPVDENNQPPANRDNIDQGTADEYMWKVYGLGLRGAMRGQIFKHAVYIDEFPDLAYTFGLDFGFTADPTALVRYAKEGYNIYLELLTYHPIETSRELDATLTAVGIDKYTPITADSSDRYISETRGVVQMVTELFDMGWEISKVSKTKSIMFWLLDMKEYKIHIVKNNLYKEAKKEQENYRFKEVNGLQINQPVDKFNHFWDSGRYAHMAYELNNLEVDYS